MSAKDVKAVGIWLRVSTEDQVLGESPERHEHRARGYAEQRGWNVATVYRLDAVSGKSVVGHPECRRMLEDVAAGRIDALIFSKLARLARNTRELLEFADFFKEHAGHLVSIQEQLDTSTPSGMFFYTMMAAMGQWEREEASSRVAAASLTRAQQGRAVAGAAPFGFRWDENKRHALDPKEAPVRKLMFELFLETRRYKAVANILNDRGYRTRKGAKFTGVTVKRLLVDPIAKGRWRTNYTRATNTKGAWELKPESEWIWHDVPAIVSEEVWDQVNSIIEAQKTGPIQTKRVRHLFAGLTHCECGARMQVPSNSPKYVCPKCKLKIPLEDLETIFQEQLKGFFLSPEDIQRYLAQADDALNEKEAQLATIQAEEAGAASDLDKLMALYLSDEIPKEGFRERYQPLEDRRNRLRDQIPRLQGEIDCLKIARASSDELVREAQDLYGHWSDLTPEEKRRIVEQITDRITVGKGEVEIDLCFRPASRRELMTVGQRTHPS